MIRKSVNNRESSAIQKRFSHHWNSAIPVKNYFRSSVLFAKLPDMDRQLRALEKEIEVEKLAENNRLLRETNNEKLYLWNFNKSKK